jgi:hypothetical protein
MNHDTKLSRLSSREEHTTEVLEISSQMVTNNVQILLMSGFELQQMRAVENRDFKQETHCLHIIPKLHGN